MGIQQHTFPHWPVAMDRAMSLSYTGVAERTLRAFEEKGIVTFKPTGPRGKLIAPKVQLDRMVDIIFTIGTDVPSEDMDFG